MPNSYGTGRDYLLNRLKREGYFDYAAAVEAGEISAFAVAVELGWSKRPATNGYGSQNQAKCRNFRLSKLGFFAAEEDHRPEFRPEALRLFAELERVPLRQRDSQAFKDGEHELMRRLDLVNEFWSMNSVLDRARGPCHPPSCVAYHDFYRCRAVRLKLLAATGVGVKRAKANGN